MPLSKVIVLAILQGLAELLPVSSSAHVIVAEKLMGLDPSSPPMTLLLVMLHTGTMFAVIVYFWQKWRSTYWQSLAAFKKFAGLLTLASVFTGVVAEASIQMIEKTVYRDVPHAQIEDLFSRLDLIAPALALVGLLILIAGILDKRGPRTLGEPNDLNLGQAGLIGAVQGLCLPFRGFSRSGATISVGILAGVPRSRAETFSFALAVILTPPVVARETMRLIQAEQVRGFANLASTIFLSVVGSVLAFLAGLLALRWLSQWLEGGRWYLFGIYCLLAAFAVAVLHHVGY
jgi:undecaprenyl-diphosphatase